MLSDMWQHGILPSSTKISLTQVSLEYIISMDVLDCPTIIIPATLANKTTDQPDKAFKPLTDLVQRNKNAY